MTQTPAGWFPDPEHPGQQRYWDGAQWTAHTQPLAGPAVPPPNSSRATTSLILGILSIAACLGFLTGIPAMVIGRGAMKEIDASGGTLGGRGLAQGGFWTGLVGTFIGTCALGLVIGLFWFGNEAETIFQETCTTITSEDSFTTECR